MKKIIIILIIPLLNLGNTPVISNIINPSTDDCEGLNNIEINEVYSNYNGFGVCCFGGNNGFIDITVTGGTGNYTYTWNNGETSEDLSNIGAGTYAVTATDENGCSGSIEVIITEPENMTISVSRSSYHGEFDYGVSCNGATDGFIDITVTGGTGNYTYAWDNGETTQDLGDIGAGSYTVIATDGNGNSISIEVVLTESPEPDFNIIIDSLEDYTGFGVSCNGAGDGHISFSITSGDEFGWNYILQSGDAEILNSYIDSNAGVIENLSAGDYEIFFTDENGCVTDLYPFTITEAEEMIITENHSNYSSYGVSCNGATDGFIDITVTGGTGNYTYAWDNGETSEDLSNIGAGSYAVTATDENGCSASIEIELTEPDELIITKSMSEYACGYNVSGYNLNDGFIDITVTGGAGNYTYEWSNGETSQDLENISAGTYTVTATDENGCSIFISAELNEASELNIEIQASNYSGYGVSCNGASDGSIDLNTTGGCEPYTYIWNTGDTTEDIFNLGAGTFSVLATDANGNLASAEFEITESNVMNMTENHSNYSGYGVSCNGATDGFIDINVTGGTGNYTYAWSNGETSEDLSNIGAGTYAVTATDENGCSSSIEVIITEPGLISVNFSPNDSSNFCFGDTNGFVDWISISGGDPFEPCEGDNNLAAIENFTLSCSDLTATFDCDFTYIFDFSVGDLCPESCGYCPDLLFGYEVIIINTDTNEEFNYNDNSLPAGNYLVRITDSINCTVEEGFVINHPEEVELDFGYDCLGNCINDLDGDEICDEFEIEGCDDNSACNYNPLLTDVNNDLCDYISCADDCGVPFGDNSSCTGCTIMGFCNYCPDCTINDFDSCIPFLDICSDESACNYSVIEDYYELSNFDENCVFYCEDCCEYPPLGMDCEGNDVDLQIDDWQGNKKIIKVIDVLGREVNKKKKDVLLLHIYEDGSIEKKYIIN